MLELNQFIGPLGGLLSVAFGMGCIAGWGFAMKLMNGRIRDLKTDVEREREDCHRRVEDLETQVRKLNDFMLHGMERQLAQVRESSLRIIAERGAP